ncbi:MAG: hypothetical protein IKO11_07550 [Lachnospiraceae bacterium]|nr:hypothetical protein [Lachnospiraceae bacterium]
MGQNMPQNMGPGMQGDGRTQYFGAVPGQLVGQMNAAYAQAMNPAGMNAGYGQAVNPAGMNAGYGQAVNTAGMNVGYGQAGNPAGMNAGYAQAVNPAGMNAGYGQAVNPAAMNPVNMQRPGSPGMAAQGYGRAANPAEMPSRSLPSGNIAGNVQAANPAADAEKAQTVNSASAPAPAKNRSNKGLIIFLLILLGVLLAGGVVALVILMGGNKEILPAKTSAALAVGEELAIRIDNFDDELSDVRLNYESADTGVVAIVREFDDAFIIKGVAEGETELTISGSGCKSVKIPVTVRGEGDSENE